MGFGLFVLMILFILLLAWYEFRRYEHLKIKRQSTAKVQFLRRLMGMLLLFILVSLTYWGIQNLRSFSSLGFFTAYWSICIILVLVLLVIVLVDLRAVFRQTLFMYTDPSEEEKRFQKFMKNQTSSNKH